MSLVLAAVKGGNNNDITWIDLLPSTHTHLLCQAKALAPPSYPLSLLKMVIFTFFLEVVNSCGSVLDKFVKTLAPCRCYAPAPTPPSPPAPLLELVSIQRTQCDSTDMPVASMAVDWPPLPTHFSYIDYLSPLLLMDQSMLHTYGLEALNQVWSIRGDPPFIPGAPSSGACPQKYGTSPPAHPISPPPPLGLPLACAPPNWRAWIAQHHWTNAGTPNQATGSNSPIIQFDLGAWSLPDLLITLLLTSLLYSGPLLHFTLFSLLAGKTSLLFPFLGWGPLWNQFLSWLVNFLVGPLCKSPILWL